MERERIKNNEGEQTVKVENDGISVQGSLKTTDMYCVGCIHYDPYKSVTCNNPKVCFEHNQYKPYDIVIKKVQNVSSNAGIDMVNHPQHYKTSKGLETIDVIEAFTEGLEGIEATDTGNIIKYACRWKKKNGVEDLRKIIWYANHLINHLENK